MKGQLFYLIGASGSGKDTIINYARSALADSTTPVAFARRYITRPPVRDNEAFISVTESEFERRCKQGLFALEWQAHGLRYGVDTELNYWLEQGINVVINGSRGYLNEARRQYPETVPVLIETPVEVLAQRLKDRGRESDQQIARRLQRAREFTPDTSELITIDNSDTIEKAGNQLIRIINTCVRDKNLLTRVYQGFRG